MFLVAVFCCNNTTATGNEATGAAPWRVILNIRTLLVWPGGVMVRALDLRLKRSRVRISAVPLSGNNLGKDVHTLVPLSPSSMIWYRSRGGDALRLGK